MKLSEQKTIPLILKVIGIIAVSVIMYFLIHELSHLITMLLCNGTLNNIQLGETSFVSGYVKQQYLPNALKDRVYYKPSNNGREKNLVRKKFIGGSK